MRLPARYAPLLFGALLSAIMVTIVSAFVIVVSQGFRDGFLTQWVRSCLTTWPVAFVSVTFLAPQVRKLVALITEPG